jgi:ketosteroid isomerase-like protein
MPDIEHRNAALARSMFEAFARRDAAAIAAAIPEDAVWHFPGKRGALAGEHRGRDAILQFLSKAMALTAGTFSLDLHDIRASDSGAVALFTGHGTRNGKSLDNPTCLRIDVKDGRLAEVWEFVWDLQHVEDFWS